MHALIDGDIITYRCAFSAQSSTALAYPGTADEFVDGEGGRSYATVSPLLQAETVGQVNKTMLEQGYRKGVDYHVVESIQPEPVAYCLYSVRNTIENIVAALGADSYDIYLSGETNFRLKTSTLIKYKGQRARRAKPYHYDNVRDYMMKVHHAIMCEGFEADDALADDQTKDTVICSIDKDLLQVPGRHFNWTVDPKTKPAKVLITPETGLVYKWRQVLTGDNVDNIPGIKGLGPKRAASRLRIGMSEDKMRDICIREWRRAMTSGKIGLLDADGIAKAKALGARGVVDQIHRLVKVGGPYPDYADPLRRREVLNNEQDANEEGAGSTQEGATPQEPSTADSPTQPIPELV